MKIASVKPKPYKRGIFDRNPLQRDHQALGEFITACSLIEVSFHRTLRRWLALDDDIARGLIGEPRHKELVDLLKFAFNVQMVIDRSQSNRDLLNAVCSEATFINSVRSVVAHKPCWSDGVEIEFSNKWTANKKSKLFSYTTSAKQIRECSHWAIAIALMIRLFGDPESDDHEETFDMHRRLLASVDRSKLPSPPPGMNQQTATRTPQRQPSQASPRKGK